MTKEKNNSIVFFSFNNSINMEYCAISPVLILFQFSVGSKTKREREIIYKSDILNFRNRSLEVHRVIIKKHTGSWEEKKLRKGLFPKQIMWNKTVKKMLRLFLWERKNILPGRVNR